nr:hypothetical protein [Dysgonomonas sp. HGC4]
MSQNSKNKKAEDFNLDDYINPQKGLSNSTIPIEQPLASEITVNTQRTDNTVPEKKVCSFSQQRRLYPLSNVKLVYPTINKPFFQFLRLPIVKPYLSAMNFGRR